MDSKELGKKIVELRNAMDDEKIENATDEELMTYLFLVEKMKKKLEKLSDLK